MYPINLGLKGCKNVKPGGDSVDFDGDGELRT